MVPRILVADDDAWILRMIAAVLEKRGFIVDTAQQGKEALAIAKRCQPDLIITDVVMPHMDGWTLVRTLRSHSEFAFVPIIFLTALNDHDDRIRGFRLGVDDYLAKPFRFEELDLRVTKTLRNRIDLEDRIRRQLTRQTTQSDTADMCGKLEHIGLSSLLTLLDMDRKSGTLSITNSQSGDSCRIFLRNGRVVVAQLEQSDEINNAECIFHVLRWAIGEFRFVESEVDLPDEVGESTAHLLMEGARLADEEQNH